METPRAHLAAASVERLKSLVVAVETPLFVFGLNRLDHGVELGLAYDEVVLHCSSKQCVGRLPLLFLESKVTSILLLSTGVVVWHFR